MSSPVKSRVQAGVPAGGQFAPTQLAESDLVLDADELSGPSGEELNRFVQASALHWSLRTGADQDDLAQDAAVAFLEAEARRKERIANGETVEKTQQPDAFVHRIARNIAVQTAFNVTRTEDFEAGRRYRSNINALQQEMGRELTEREKDEIADSIRLAMPPKRRPTIGFHRPTTVLSMDTTHNSESNRGASWVDAVADDNAEYRVVHREFEEDSAGQVALDLAETGKRGNLVQARAIAWDAIAQFNGSPSIVTDRVSERHAGKHRKQVKASGGVIEVAKRWENGTSTIEEEDALFSPFGEIDVEEKGRVVETMHRTSKYADDLWDVALTGATKKRKTDD